MTLPSPDLPVRPMSAQDLPRVMEIAAALPEAPHWPLSSYAAALNPQNQPHRIALVAASFSGGPPEAFLIASLVPPQAELESIAVSAQSQRRGLATQLFGHLLPRLRAHSISELILEVRASNHPARAFYLARGFREFGRRPRYYADPQEDAVLMSLPLE